jgi:hypothetical protein
MPSRPSDIWKDLPVERRASVAEAFWRDDESADIQLQHAEAVVLLARRMKFRPKSVQVLPVERRAKHLAQVAEVSDAIATRALIAYHFTEQRPLMGAFLDALGIAHDRGLISTDQVEPPSRDRLVAAVTAVKSEFSEEDVALYLRTLSALDGDTWGALDDL